MRFILISIIILCGCAHWAQAADLTDKEFKAAKEIYLAKCAKCHEFHSPGDYKKPAWDQWMGKMGRKAKLNPEQLDLVARYTENLRLAGDKK